MIYVLIVKFSDSEFESSCYNSIDDFSEAIEAVESHLFANEIHFTEAGRMSKNDTYVMRLEVNV